MLPNVPLGFGVRGLDPALTFGGYSAVSRREVRRCLACHIFSQLDANPDGRKSGVKPPHSKASRHSEICFRLEFIIDLHAVRFERVNRLHMAGLCVEFKPPRRAPRILICDWHQSMSHGVLMHVIQPRKIALFIREPRVAIVVPIRASRRAVEFIDERRSARVKLRHKRAQIRRIGRRGFADEMNVIREHRPSLQRPAVFLCQSEQLVVQKLELHSSREAMGLQISAASEDVSPALSQPMFWSMGPRYFVRRHSARMSDTYRKHKPRPECREALECGGLTPLFLSSRFGLSVEQSSQADPRLTVVRSSKPTPPKVKAGSSPRTPKASATHYVDLPSWTS